MGGDTLAPDQRSFLSLLLLPPSHKVSEFEVRDQSPCSAATMLHAVGKAGEAATVGGGENGEVAAWRNDQEEQNNEQQRSDSSGWGRTEGRAAVAPPPALPDAPACTACAPASPSPSHLARMFLTLTSGSKSCWMI